MYGWLCGCVYGWLCGGLCLTNLMSSTDISLVTVLHVRLYVWLVVGVCGYMGVWHLFRITDIFYISLWVYLYFIYACD